MITEATILPVQNQFLIVAVSVFKIETGICNWTCPTGERMIYNQNN